MYERDARMAKLDQFGVDATLLFIGEFVATFGYYPQNKTGVQVLNAYNRYMHDNWGFAHQNRLFTTALLSVWDLEASIAEAKWLIKNGAKVICMPMGPVDNKSPAHPYFDPLWEILNEAKHHHRLPCLGGELHAPGDSCLGREAAAEPAHRPDCLAVDVLLFGAAGADDAREHHLP